MTTFHPPGPGSWMRLGDHFPGALTAEYRRIYSETAPAGMADYMARYGVLADGIDVGFVNGHLYISPRPLAGPRGVTRTPPALLVWLMSRVHPGFRRRTSAAATALAERPWRSATEHWFTTERAHWVDRASALASIEPDRLDVEDLAAHLVACRALAVDGYLRHFQLHGDDLLPIGLLITRAGELGIDANRAMATVEGASPLSAGTTEPPAWQLITGYDLDSLAWCELTQRPVRRRATEAHPPGLPEALSAEQRAELTELIVDARAAIPLRDDNGAVNGAWPMGLLRRAMLATGRRLGLEPSDLAIEATVDELTGALLGQRPLPGEHLADRASHRRQQSRLEAPDELGPTFGLPPLTALPRPLALIGAAQLAASDHMRGMGAAVGIGTRAHIGRALVVDDPAMAFDLIEPGDVVVTHATCPSWNAVLTLAGAIVTTQGGVASHAAVMARELSIPAVLGDRSAMSRLHTGDQVEVDPTTSTVRRMGAASAR